MGQTWAEGGVCRGIDDGVRLGTIRIQFHTLNSSLIMSTSETPPVAPVTEDRTIAILAYITILGFIIAIVMHNGKKTRIGSFHLRQALGLFITGFVCTPLFIIPVLNLLMIPVLMIAFFVLWIIGVIAAVNGQEKPVPVVGEYYQKWFAGAFV
jgi:uncharacterized membrane protein